VAEVGPQVEFSARPITAEKLRPARVEFRVPPTPPVAAETTVAESAVIPPIRRDTVFRRTLAVADMAAALMGMFTVSALAARGIPTVTLVAVPFIVLMAKVAGRYDHDEVVLRKSTLEEIPSLLGLSAVFALAWSAAAFASGTHLDLHGAGVVVLWASTGAGLIIARSSARALAAAVAPAERALIVGDAQSRARVTQALSYDPTARVDVIGYLPLEEGEDQLAFSELKSAVATLGADRVFLVPSREHTEEALDLVRRTAAVGVKVSIVPRLFEVVGSAVEFDAVGGMTVLGVRRPGLTKSSQLVKRTLDLAVSSISIVLLAPLAAVVALAIKLDSPGPVFFRQSRVGRDGRSFWMIKFRSMVDGAEQARAELEDLNESIGLFKLTRDPRVTRVGRVLRRCSLDELPQIINVLRGEMSLVGPRPLILDEDALVEGWHRDRLLLTPGMTGAWQVLGPPRPPLAEMVKVDYLYAANWSLWNDIKIILRTLRHVVGRRGV
jgi:exopolysaccharide biosynthesis polyprenyl glycosylphosphotransferase